ncbi:hypothetical protein F9L16_10040 [Agarivorans sp. B2Z047]|uniref:AbiU2 domain-containing protein n=1 Tax=Agarivorans sp. B2Z047 TaxID=2652721 RepID=UPI00128D1FB0|nr:hypothetical protein [Agarivorans sp. B2Z047]MPW29337.1 hypothetical protein [Agarivorans sp. B2Z047]UQN44923.1 hypothetical protein LQZ07_10800 [Agarivorans sp. B2Z047]
METSIDEASSHFETWWALGFSENRHRFKEAFESPDYNYFLHTCCVANQIAMFMALSRAFDTCTKSSRFRKLRTLLLEEGLENLVMIIDEKLSPFKSLISRILTIRSQLIAHSETNKTDEDVLGSNGVKPEEIRSLIDASKDVLVAVAITLRVHNLCFTTGRHNHSALEILKKLES